ncbi:hypothetical protein MAKP6SUB1_16010 [Klebsiella pneumoniae]|nr:hypothetical protein MAKP3_15950 [Klebsiella pneumoniae]GKM88578.1 hypothetical protein NUKP68_53510 [Klebsiella variicola]BCU21523.1 hypothetical protein MAKP4_15960 [Klebsiella pneumoniae]BCU26679.1 hypothetical protein MAKP5_15930 [Klebsiella pneumoniae]BCU31998.1 hypothetical protein MAKP6SUB1_16010 [Klebsiella pneumoniae]
MFSFAVCFKACSLLFSEKIDGRVDTIIEFKIKAHEVARVDATEKRPTAEEL